MMASAVYGGHTAGAHRPTYTAGAHHTLAVLGGEERHPPPARVRLRALALAAGGEPPRTACRSRVGSGLCLVRGQGEARASSAAG
jgi:hypothetical protein